MFLFYLILFYISFEVFSFFLIFNNFLIFFIVFYLLSNFFLKSIYNKNDFNYDILYKYTIFYFKKISFFLNYLSNIFNKIFYYIFNFKFIDFKNFFKFIFFKFKNFFLYWRPIFKKNSYFGYFRSSRNKWIK